jgi:6-phosphofructokinase 1
MRKVAVLTSGGDAPGMNAAIRAVVRTGVARGWEVFGVPNGYAGLLDGRFLPLGARDVGGIIQQGGTVLGSARSTEFRTGEGQARALELLLEQCFDGLVVIGGNGSQTGAYELSKRGFPVVGVASTVDNDLLGCDITIGADTALNVALEAIDRLKITAASHHRVFAVEVMGRDCGYLALMAAIAGGAEVAIIPEVEVDPEQVVRSGVALRALRVKRRGRCWRLARCTLTWPTSRMRSSCARSRWTARRNASAWSTRARPIRWIPR